MSNEEIAVRIQAGETDLMEQLWAGVEKLVRWKANRVGYATGGRCGVDSDDLYQCGYFAMVAAVETYNHENGSFANWLSLYLKTVFEEATGRRTKKGRMEPLNNSVSLDKPLGDEADGASFATMDSIEEKLWQDQLREAMESVLAELPDEQRNVLRHRYYDQRSLVGTAERMGMTAEDVRKLEDKGIKALRHYKLANRIRPFYDFDYYGGAGLGAFRNSGMSIQERYLIRMERDESKRTPPHKI